MSTGGAAPLVALAEIVSLPGSFGQFASNHLPFTYVFCVKLLTLYVFLRVAALLGRVSSTWP